MHTMPTSIADSAVYTMRWVKTMLTATRRTVGATPEAETDQSKSGRMVVAVYQLLSKIQATKWPASFFGPLYKKKWSMYYLDAHKRFWLDILVGWSYNYNHFLAHSWSLLFGINPGVSRPYIGYTNCYVKVCQDLHPPDI